jgi:GDP-4-dehydro-6-deoxy-D-mannose reductase
MQRALITGINGFVGGYLAEHLIERQWHVGGIATSAEIRLPSLRPHVDFISVDLLDAQATRRALKHTRPDVIFHLAAQAHVPTAVAHPVETITNNLQIQLQLFEAIRGLSLDPLIVVACTSEEYGSVRPDDIPIDEETPLRPSNPYAFSKVAQDMLALQYFLGYGMRTIRLRLFNHIGPRQSDSYAIPAFAHQIARIEAGLQEPIVRVGNLDVQRDFTDVRDVARAYELAALQGVPGEVYNVGSGRAVALREILRMLIGLSTATIVVEPDPARIRPVDVPVIACDATRFYRQTGWHPTIALHRSLADVLAEWRGRAT